MNMSVHNYSIGQLNPVVYFENNRGEISLPPSTDDALRIKDQMLKRGWVLKEADTLAKVDVLQKRLQDIEYRRSQKELEHEEVSFGSARKRIRENLYSRMVSSSTSEYEKEFIRCYLQLSEHKRAEYQKRFTADISYLNMRENDNTNHIKDLVDKIPDTQDTTCVKCGKFRRVQGSKFCAGCIPREGRI